MIYFKRVDNSGDESLLIFFKPANSASIFLSSPDVRILKVTKLPELGKVKVNSFTPSVIKDSSKDLLSKRDKSITYDSPS